MRIKDVMQTAAVGFSQLCRLGQYTTPPPSPLTHVALIARSRFDYISAKHLRFTFQRCWTVGQFQLFCKIIQKHNIRGVTTHYVFPFKCRKKRTGEHHQELHSSG